MEAALLMLEAVGIGIVLLWCLRGRGEQGVLAWRTERPKRPGRR